MKRICLAALAIVSLAGTPALAQYYGGPYGGPYGGYDEDDFAPRFRRAPPYFDPYGGGRRFYERRARAGSVCVTSRGECSVGPAPIQSRCRCMIPGFGPKRGNVLY